MLITAILSALPAASQQKQAVVSKVITKSISMASSDALSIVGEKAHIAVSGWDKDYAQVKILFSASNVNRAVAVREFEFMQYAITREKNIIELRNAYVLPFDVDQIRSMLNVTFEIMLPARSRLSITNKYGTIELKSLSGEINASFSFCDLFVTGISGKASLKPSYSEVRGEVNSPLFFCDAEKSEIFLELSGGAYTFKTSLGDIDLDLKSILSLNVKASHTGVTLRTASVRSFNYDLATRNGKIYAADIDSRHVKEEDRLSTLFYKPEADNALIEIYTTYSPITIK